MKEVGRATKKPYAPPRLRRYGDLRTLTRGNKRTRPELTGIKTKLSGAG